VYAGLAEAVDALAEAPTVRDALILHPFAVVLYYNLLNRVTNTFLPLSLSLSPFEEEANSQRTLVRPSPSTR
jgi:hypothetical protein